MTVVIDQCICSIKLMLVVCQLYLAGNPLTHLSSYRKLAIVNLHVAVKNEVTQV